MRTGYYVEGKYFNTKLAQAQAFAANRAQVFGRNVKIVFVDHTLKEKLVETSKFVRTDALSSEEAAA